MKPHNKTLDQLIPGENAIIDHFTDGTMSLKFLEMGCIPGEPVRLSSIAPLGDPIAIEVCGYKLSMRKTEASTIVVTTKN